jgi:hypothetical protein
MSKQPDKPTVAEKLAEMLAQILEAPIKKGGK